ncbi:MAG: hypothetical protein LBK59_07190 [Bifidobacteriaceae bacterium]|jgi:hypothetical protein|nr:hypothetical protein [Bifidobacteriaceae bacterium]
MKQASSLSLHPRVPPTQLGSNVARKAGTTRPGKVTPEVLAAYATGTPAAVLADQCGVSPDTITRHARLAGITPPDRCDAPAQEQVDEIVEAYAQEEQIVTIGQRIGMGHRRVRPCWWLLESRFIPGDAGRCRPARSLRSSGFVTRAGRSRESVHVSR